VPDVGDGWSPEQGSDRCPIARTLRVIDGRWSTLIVRELLDGTKRFGELKRALDGISPKTLTDRLRTLEAQGVLTRTVHAEIPPRVEYALTDYGRTLEDVLRAMAAWGRRQERVTTSGSD
jgi:DNA-binding HxlR family transcriptional regulator